MIDKTLKRFRILHAYLRRGEFATDVDFIEMMRSTFQMYGLKKWVLKNRAHFETAGEFSIFHLDGRKVFWPGQANSGRLIDMYFEVFCQNAHRFDRTPTLVEQGDVVIDVGCCEGFFSLNALEKGATKVYGFEPGRGAVRALEKTFENEVEKGRMEIVGKLLGEVPGELVFSENPNDPTVCAVLPMSSMLANNCYKVPVTTLDTFAAERELVRVDFLKVDVEGYELEVLRGGAGMIKKNRPKIAIAANHRPEHAAEIRKLLEEIDSGYRFKLNGLVDFDGIVRPVMLHSYVEQYR